MTALDIAMLFGAVLTLCVQLSAYLVYRIFKD